MKNNYKNEGGEETCRAYITNIQLDIDEIDDEIEEIMEVQSSNNNADISELENEQEEIHVVKNINELAG